MIYSASDRPAGGYSPGTGFGEVDAPAALTMAARLAVGRPDIGLSAGLRFGPAPGPFRSSTGYGPDRRLRRGGRGPLLAGLVLAGLLIVRLRRCRSGRRPLTDS